MIQNLSKNTAKYNETNGKLRIAIVRSSYYPTLSKSLEKACRRYLIAEALKEKNIETFEVPGSWEIPLIVKNIAQTGKFNGVVALGVIIKGETYHFEMIANQCAKALINISLEFNIPISFGILAVYNLQQAKQRSSGKLNKGIEAAQAILKIIKAVNKVKL